MNDTRGRRFFWIALGLATLPMAGCTGFGSLQAPWSTGQQASSVPGVVTPRERIAAIRQLAKEAPGTESARAQEIVRQLGQSIRTEEDPMIRLEIVRALGAYGSISDALLEAAMSDPDKEVRIEACEIWGRRGGAKAVQLLGRALQGDQDVDVRLAAIRALGESKDPTAVAPLGLALEDRDPAVQYRSVQSLRSVTGEELGNDVGQWRQYVAGQMPAASEVPSLAERFRDFSTF